MQEINETRWLFRMQILATFSFARNCIPR